MKSSEQLILSNGSQEIEFMPEMFPAHRRTLLAVLLAIYCNASTELVNERIEYANRNESKV